MEKEKILRNQLMISPLFVIIAFLLFDSKAIEKKTLVLVFFEVVSDEFTSPIFIH